MGLVPLMTPAHFTKRRSSQLVVASTPTSPRSPLHRTRSLLAASTPEDAAVSPVSGAGSVFSAAQEDTGVIADLPGSEFDTENHPAEQESSIDWDRWWVDNVVLPVPNGNPIDGSIQVDQVLQQPRYAEVAGDIEPAATGAVNNRETEIALENEVQPGVKEVEGRPIKRNRWGEVTVAIASVACLWFTGVLKGLGRGAA